VTGQAARALLAAAAAALLPGCVTLAMLRPLPRACPGPLPAVAELGDDFSLQARYRVRSGDKDYALTLAAEKRGGRLVLLGIDPLGTGVFALVQEGTEVRRERHLRPLFPFAPENVLRDLILTRWTALAEGPEASYAREGDATTITRPGCDWTATVSGADAAS
jgi:hypothetical protein